MKKRRFAVERIIQILAKKGGGNETVTYAQKTIHRRSKDNCKNNSKNNGDNKSNSSNNSNTRNRSNGNNEKIEGSSGNTRYELNKLLSKRINKLALKYPFYKYGRFTLTSTIEKDLAVV